MRAESNFVTGIKEIDKHFPGLLARGNVLVIAGNPGSGKTTLASTICYNNALRGERCLYVSFQEPREKLFGNMLGLGMRLGELEERALIRFVHFPVTAAVEDVASNIVDLINEFGPSVAVVDSINPLMMFISTKEQRAWLQNLFYNLTALLDGAVVLIAELPYGEERIPLGDIEFVADSIIVLKHRIDVGKLVRVMEIRKVRGAPLRVAELPFRIVGGRGIRVFAPPTISEEISLETVPVTSTKLLGDIYAGDVILLTYPPEAFTPVFGYLLVEMALRGKVKALGILYSLDPAALSTLMSGYLVNLGLSDKELRVLKEFISFERLNPYGMSLEELAMQIIDLVDEHNAKILALAKVETFEPTWRANPRRYMDVLSNFLLTLKKRGIVVVRLTSKISEEFTKVQQSISTLIVDYNYRISEETGQLIEYLKIIRKGESPRIVRVSPSLLNELANIIKSK